MLNLYVVAFTYKKAYKVTIIYIYINIYIYIYIFSIIYYYILCVI